ncbi:MAG: MoaD/ThiS family protein [Chitinophagaceae bacterium]|nr:MoaD/ThiS family protein [Chitinophagaceae bacterium]
MSINLLFFGQLSTLVGSNNMTIENIVDTESLQLYLFEKFPEMANAKFVIALNNEVILKNTVVNIGDTLAFLPPFSGG